MTSPDIHLTKNSIQFGTLDSRDFIGLNRVTVITVAYTLHKVIQIYPPLSFSHELGIVFAVTCYKHPVFEDQGVLAELRSKK